MSSIGLDSDLHLAIIRHVLLLQTIGKGFNMDYSNVIDKLNDILQHEWTGVAQYSQAGFVVTGLWREVYAGLFHKNAEESYGHAKLIGDKIAALGGVPSVERNPVRQSQDVQELLEFGLEFESKAVELYNEALQLSQGDRALGVFLEDILKEEQDGVDEISKLVRDSQSGSAGQTASRAG